MTNILFFSTINRDEESASSSSRSEITEPPQTVIKASLSAYSVIGKAWSACARPQLQVDEDIDTSTTSTSVSAESNTKESESVKECSNLKSISYMELETATSEFHSSNLLGSGKFGEVFKGWINENTLTATEAGKGIAVAVKRVHQPHRSVTEWVKEVNYLGHLYHPNLVRTLAYCTQGVQRMVVYEFMPRGSLGDHLFQRGSDSEPLSWSLRIKIALDAAKGLNFLHAIQAVHGNIKPSNILLDSYYNSKLAFGVDKTTPVNIEAIWGIKTSELDFVDKYTAPECIRKGSPTATGDVYSFGVVLLEILFGCKVAKSVLNPIWVNMKVHSLIPFLERKFLADKYAVEDAESAIARTEVEPFISFHDRSFLKDKYAARDAKSALALVTRCLCLQPFSRITMDLVVKDLTLYMKRCLKEEKK